MSIYNPLPLLKGLWTTIKAAFFEPIVTTQYPEEKRTPRPRFRGRHNLHRYDNGLERCIGCALCAAACPAQAIFVEASENTDEKRFSPGERYASTYQINLLRCIYCGFCEDSCPTEAIRMGSEYELSYTVREDAFVNREDLLLKPKTGAMSTPQKHKAGEFTRSIPKMEDPKL
jgi:NADH-quinone oxidoreductase subunit I